MGKEAKAKKPQDGATTATLTAEEYWEFRARVRDVEKIEADANRAILDAMTKRDQLYATLAAKYHLPAQSASMQWNDETKAIAVMGARRDVEGKGL